MIVQLQTQGRKGSEQSSNCCRFAAGSPNTGYERWARSCSFRQSAAGGGYTAMQLLYCQWRRSISCTTSIAEETNVPTVPFPASHTCPSSSNAFSLVRLPKHSATYSTLYSAAISLPTLPLDRNSSAIGPQRLCPLHRQRQSVSRRAAGCQCAFRHR